MLIDTSGLNNSIRHNLLPKAEMTGTRRDSLRRGKYIIGRGQHNSMCLFLKFGNMSFFKGWDKIFTRGRGEGVCPSKR